MDLDYLDILGLHNTEAGDNMEEVVVDDMEDTEHEVVAAVGDDNIAGDDKEDSVVEVSAVDDDTDSEEEISAVVCRDSSLLCHHLKIDTSKNLVLITSCGWG